MSKYLFSDASFLDCGDDKRYGAYAFVYLDTYLNKLHISSGDIDLNFLKDVSSTDCEIFGCIEGLTYVNKEFSRNQRINLFCDNNSVIRYWRKKNGSKHRYYKLNNIYNSKRIKYNHVKGHTGKKDVVSMLNNWCDIRASAITNSRKSNSKLNFDLNKGGIGLDYCWRRMVSSSQMDSELLRVLNINYSIEKFI